MLIENYGNSVSTANNLRALPLHVPEKGGFSPPARQTIHFIGDSAILPLGFTMRTHDLVISPFLWQNTSKQKNN